MFKTLPGFREFYPEDCAIRNHIFSIWRRSTKQFGFQEYDAPLLEPLELFTEKSGEEIVEQLFAFTDRGGRSVALRPELTPSLARLVGAKINSMRKPVKWFAIGENFRYERPQKGRLRSFFQLNCDILGEPGPSADAEAVALLIHCLSSFGLDANDFAIRLSDRDFWVYFLREWSLKESHIHQVLSIIDKMERTPEEKTLELLSPFFGAKTEKFIESAQELAKISSLEQLTNFTEKHASNKHDSSDLKSRLVDWAYLIETLEGLNLAAFIKIDFSIVRGLAYYTGFVYEAFQKTGTARALAGGGRYDNLIKKLGGPDTPATGFAIGDVTLRDFLEEKNLIPKYVDAPEIFFVLGGEEERKSALPDITKLRQAGFRVEYPMKPNAINKQIKLADQLGAHFALIYGSEEIASNSILVKDLKNRTEKKVPTSNLVDYISSLSH